MKSKYIGTLILAGIILATGLYNINKKNAAPSNQVETYTEVGEVNIYSARKEKLIKPLLDIFAEKNNLKVNLVTGKADALLKRLKLEGENSPADLLITVDAGRLNRAVEAGITQPTKSEILDAKVPSAYRDADKHWYGLSMRARPIFYVKDKVDPSTLSTYEALADEQWKGRICIRSSSNIYNQSLVASMISNLGVEKTQAWANAFAKNFARKPSGGDRDQITAAAAGACDIAIANSYYYGRMVSGKDEAQKQATDKVAIFWPNQSDRGTHVNISGITMTKSAKNKEHALKLMEFLISTEAQDWYAKVNNEYPVVQGSKTSQLLSSWGNFKADELNLSEIGKNNSAAVKVMDIANWK